MMDDIFERGTVEEQIAAAIVDLNCLAETGKRLEEFATRGIEAVERGKPQIAMRYVQRIRFLCQMNADVQLMLLDDLHVLATGLEDFDHEAWLEAQGEQDYDAVTFAMKILDLAPYAAGRDIEGRFDE
jgi:Holliday junction resolvasome RuvABC ATP-dependent DNA helicase subunit